MFASAYWRFDEVMSDVCTKWMIFAFLRKLRVLLKLILDQNKISKNY